MEVTKDQAKKIADDLRKAAEEVFAKHGLSVGKETSGYGDYFTFKIEAYPVNLSAEGINLSSPEATMYERFGYSGFQKNPVTGQEDLVHLTAPLGTEFVSGGKKYRFAGVKSRGKNRIIAIQQTDGKTYVFADGIIKTLNAVAEKASK